MSQHDRVNILMVDAQPAKLLSYEVILSALDENLMQATSGRQALEHLLQTDIAVVLIDVNMPDLDGFELAALIRQHPRCQQTAIIFISAAHLTDLAMLKGYEHGAVDYITVPVIPELLRAKVRVFADLYRKTQQLARLNCDLEQRVSERTAALQQAHADLERRVAERTTALHRALAEQQRLEREARRGEHFALLGRLAAAVSHEIRNPLAAIFLHADLLEEELHQPSPESTVAMAESLTEIKRQLVRLEDLVQDYLSLARIATLERTPQDLGTVAQDWAHEWQCLATAHGVTLHLEGIAHLGQAVFHEHSLRRVVFNLVHNALDAMPQGGALTLLGQGTATQVQLHVRDTGIGISAAQLPHIFEPLYTTKPEGTGLGLYIAQEIITAHAGQITVESVEGQGTTFILTLPRTVAPAGAP